MRRAADLRLKDGVFNSERFHYVGEWPVEMFANHFSPTARVNFDKNPVPITPQANGTVSRGPRRPRLILDWREPVYWHQRPPINFGSTTTAATPAAIRSHVVEEIEPTDASNCVDAELPAGTETTDPLARRTVVIG